MLGSALLKSLELLTPAEPKAIRAIAEYLLCQRAEGSPPESAAAALLAELPQGEPRFATPDEGLSPARLAARRFMRENPSLIRLLAQ
jgi:hypothetical protein